jgi:hypothetical protein
MEEPTTGNADLDAALSGLNKETLADPDFMIGFIEAHFPEESGGIDLHYDSDPQEHYLDG